MAPLHVLSYFPSLYRGRQEGGLIRSKEEEGLLEDGSRASTEETKREKPSHKGISRNRKEKHSPSKCLRVSSISRQNATNCPLHLSSFNCICLLQYGWRLEIETAREMMMEWEMEKRVGCAGFAKKNFFLRSEMKRNITNIMLTIVKSTDVK